MRLSEQKKKEERLKKTSEGIKICECCNLNPVHPGFYKLCYACYTGVKYNNFDYDYLEFT